MAGRTFPLPFHHRAFPLPFSGRSFPLAFDELAREFGQYVALLEVDWVSGTSRYSFNGVRSPEYFYSDQIISLGTVTRETPSIGGPYSISDLSVSLANREQEFSKLADDDPIFGREVRLLFGDVGRGLSQMQRIFTGIITDDNDITDTVFTFRAEDVRFERYDQKLSASLKTLVSSVFPDLPVGQDPHIVPVVYGACDVDPDADLATYEDGGPLPCYLIDPAISQSKYRYVVAQHACKAVDHVFVYGIEVTTGFAIAEATYDTQLMTVIDFDSDPRDSARSNTLEVTASVSGKTDDGLSSGNLITNPAEQFADYLDAYAGTPSGDLDTASYSSVQARMNTDGYAGAWAVVERDDTHAEIGGKWSESFQCQIFATKQNEIGFYLNTTDALATPLITFREHEMGRFRILSNRGNIATHLQYNWLYSYPKGYFGRQPTYAIPGEEASLGSRFDDNMNQWFVRDATTALAVVQAAADLHLESARLVQFDLSPDGVRLVDMQSVVGVTHFEGIASGGGGWVNNPVRVISLSLDADPRGMKVGIVAVTA